MDKDLITVIILTKNEEKNIEASIRSAKRIASRILVIDSGSSDKTVELAQNMGAEVVYHEWHGYANQFNWALDNCGIDTPWVFRLDADERISDELVEEINNKLPTATADGFEMRLRIYFMGKWIKHGGTHKQYFLRLFRYGKGRVTGLMDEGVEVDGTIERLKNDFLHYDYKGLDEWSEKHIYYTNRELMLISDVIDDSTKKLSHQYNRRRIYYKLPMFVRARLYYWYRYYFQMGFLDGREGKIFSFFQAYWYRFLVDAKIYEIENRNK